MEILYEVAINLMGAIVGAVIGIAIGRWAARRW